MLGESFQAAPEKAYHMGFPYAAIVVHDANSLDHCGHGPAIAVSPPKNTFENHSLV